MDTRPDRLDRVILDELNDVSESDNCGSQAMIMVDGSPPAAVGGLPPEQHRISAAVSRLFRITARAKHDMASQDPDLRDFAVMVVLAPLVEHGPLRSTALADAVLMDPSQVSRHVATAVHDGLVERRADPGDGRAIRLVVTPAGEERFGRFTAARARHLDAVVADWEPAEVEQFGRSLDRFVRALEKRLTTTGTATTITTATPTTTTTSPETA